MSGVDLIGRFGRKGAGQADTWSLARRQMLVIK